MHPKTTLALFLALALLCACLPVAAEETEPLLQGLVTETGSGYFLIDDTNQGTVRVALDDSTVYEGIVSQNSLAVGQYVYVRYNGVMTRSLPPQVTAEKISCFAVTGTVMDILDYGYTVEGDEVLGTVIIHTQDAFPIICKGVPITVYYSGVMALSYPPQITAVYTVVPVLQGVASAVTADGFTLTDDEGTAYSVSVEADTGLYTLPADDQRLTVYYNGTLTEGAAVTALAVVSPEAEAAQGGTEE